MLVGVQTLTTAPQAPQTDIIDTPQTFGKTYKFSPQCVRNYCHSGRIPTVICSGKIIRFYRHEALAALAGKGKGETK